MQSRGRFDIARFERDLDDERYRVFRDTVEMDVGEIITTYLDLRADLGQSGTLQTISIAEQALEARGIQATGQRVDLIAAMFGEFGVPLEDGSRAFLSGQQWTVQKLDGSIMRLVDWDKERRGALDE